MLLKMNHTLPERPSRRSFFIAGQVIGYHYNHRVGLFWAECPFDHALHSYQAKTLEGLKDLLMAAYATEAAL